MLNLYFVSVPVIVIVPEADATDTLPEPLILTFPLFEPPPTKRIYGLETEAFAVPPVFPAYKPKV